MMNAAFIDSPRTPTSAPKSSVMTSKDSSVTSKDGSTNSRVSAMLLKNSWRDSVMSSKDSRTTSRSSITIPRSPSPLSKEFSLTSRDSFSTPKVISTTSKDSPMTPRGSFTTSRTPSPLAREYPTTYCSSYSTRKISSMDSRSSSLTPRNSFTTSTGSVITVKEVSITPKRSFKQYDKWNSTDSRKMANARTPLLSENKFRRMSTTEAKRRASMAGTLIQFPHPTIPNPPEESCKMRFQNRRESTYWRSFEMYVPFLASGNSMDCPWKKKAADQFVAIQGQSFPGTLNIPSISNISISSILINIIIFFILKVRV